MHHKVRHPCNQCEKTFSSSYILADHIRSSHFGEKFHCYLCNKHFSTKGKVAQHVKSACNYGLRYSCKLCDESFHAYEDLESHNTNVHTKVKPGVGFICGICSITLKSNRDLAKHASSVHGTAAFACKHQDCDEIFSEKLNLVAHIRDVHLSVTKKEI